MDQIRKDHYIQPVSFEKAMPGKSGTGFAFISAERVRLWDLPSKQRSEENGKKMKSINKVLVAASLLALPVAGFAAPIDGELGISGSLAPTCSVDPTPAPCTMDIADGLTFAGSGTGNQFLVTFATGDFATSGLGFGDIGSIVDFMFDPLSPSPVDPLWMISSGGIDWEFALETVNIVAQTANFIDLRGTGTLSGTGFDDTLGIWTLSTDSANQDLTFSWSSTTLAPEPGILLLLGMGLIGVFGARRLS